MSGKDRGARLMFRTNRRRRIKNRMWLLPAHYLSTGAIFDQVRSNNRTSPINRTRNHKSTPGIPHQPKKQSIAVVPGLVRISNRVFLLSR